MVLFWRPESGPEKGTQRVSLDCRGSLFVFQIFARIVGLFLGPIPVSMCIRNAAVLFGMFMDAKRGSDDETKRICMDPWAGTDGLGTAVQL